MIPLSIIANPMMTSHAMLSNSFKPIVILDDFPEYASDTRELKPLQQSLIANLAFVIYQSLMSKSPVRAVVAVGHADSALRLNGLARLAKERDVSWSRAQSGAQALKHQLIKTAGHPSVVHMLAIKAVGIGALKKVVQNASNEQDMRKNRRIEYYLVNDTVKSPSCGC